MEANLISPLSDFNLSDFQAMLKGQDYTQETIQEITSAIESYQASLTAKRIALKSLTTKIAECKELAQIVYGKEIKVDIVFNHE
jgi:predicted transcriptional regulator